MGNDITCKTLMAFDNIANLPALARKDMPPKCKRQKDACRRLGIRVWRVVEVGLVSWMTVLTFQSFYICLEMDNESVDPSFDLDESLKSDVDHMTVSSPLIRLIWAWPASQNKIESLGRVVLRIRNDEHD